ncbi:hypothetical protein [Aurantiacibacter aquimixticola]|uniref:Uncharacterized protein n=1 Tax=Aurantiacibacter aquimixticola TaxID=1958945 RepID=A0A419RR85_9SPHN|nr:hypothetical protein [Aurantiacibacter aquimixticola]RJY08298.1 hypothetical protein D6201_02040 [Aurantiacibacter aquimixticola]
MALRALALLLIGLGTVVLTLPYWLPSVAEVRVTGETFARTGQVGGAIIGIGIAVLVVAVFRRRR